MDIDGTIIGTDGVVPASALTACRAARAGGHLLYICSGRPRSIISPAILAIGFDGVISSGGAHIETGGAVIFDAAMPEELVKNIAAYLHDRGCGFSFERNDSTESNRAYLNHWGETKRRVAGTPEEAMFAEIYERIARHLLPDDPAELCCTGVTKIGFLGSPRMAFADIAAAFAGECEIFHGSIPYSGAEGGEIGPLGIHKGSAVQTIAAYHGVPLADTLAFGDSDNDRMMLETAGIGIAMGNADDALKKIADDITAPLDKDGIFKSFLKYGLI